MQAKRQEAIRKATQLYWEKGFHATSMRNLQEVINMRPGSIYASFGSKEGLFKETLQHYTRISTEQIAAFRAQAQSPVGALKMLVEHAIMTPPQSVPSGMCMLVKTIAELTEDNAELLAQAKRLLHEVEQAFAALIDEAKDLGEISSRRDSNSLARYFQVQMMGIRTYVCASNDEHAGKALIEDLFSHAPFCIEA